MEQNSKGHTIKIQKSIGMKDKDFSLYNESVEKLMEEIQHKENSRSYILKKLKKSSKQIALTNTVKEKEEEYKEEEIENFGPPKLFSGKNIQQTDFILIFPSLHESIIDFPICCKSLYELYKISESREVFFF